MLLPFGFTVPFSVAPAVVMLVAVPVTTVGSGHAPVVNVLSAPFVVPPGLVATARKWYGVPHTNPAIAALTATGDVPDPGAGDTVT